MSVPKGPAKTGEFSSDVARALPRAFEKRLSSDYSDFVEITQDEVVRLKSDVHSFVTACREYLARLVTIEAQPPSAKAP